ncbi:N-acetyltransferase [Aequitasia blattaphilus]|uniref:GNAT family N-acetyltransferase n=1 Tax=Aequitasia blattaphilus TaxID=2949332 RepID=UPI002ED634DE
MTFGPVSVLPQLHNKGIGTKLITQAIEVAKELGYAAILIYGYEGYYQRFGFRHAKEYGISNLEGKYPAAHLVLELTPDSLTDISGKAVESSVYNVDTQKAAAYDSLFPAKEKKVMPSQQVFEKATNSFL